MDLTDFKNAIAALIPIVLIIAAFALSMNEFYDGIVDDNVAGVAIINQSVDFINATEVALNASTRDLVSLSCSAVRNYSDGIVLGAGNYTCASGGITFTDVGGYNGNATVYVDYAYKDSTHATNVSEEGLAGVSNASSYLSTIGTLLGVAALITVVVVAFMFARQ